MAEEQICWRLEVRRGGRQDWEFFEHRTPDGQLYEGSGLNSGRTAEDLADVAAFELNTMMCDEVVYAVPDAAGVRVKVWRGTNDDGEPAVLLEATEQRLAQARVSRASHQVVLAQEELEQTRSALARQVIVADGAGLSRNAIARVADSAWSRRLVLAHLSAHDLVIEIQDALGGEWTSGSGHLHQEWRSDLDNYIENDLREVGDPYSCGPIRLTFSPPENSVRISLDGAGHADLAAARTHDEVATARAEAEQRPRLDVTETHELAERIATALHERGLELCSPDGHRAGPGDLAEATLSSQIPQPRVLVRRAEQTGRSRGRWRRAARP